ncbi:putative transcriptional regulator with HTH domain [Candidatus Methanoperedens nitroreducens]|uniref:Putative transcriptional regulator with HTH domain n=1 Tax=Candidatus Methanoperedens nitratireducens TaxID=1392998 RepID=A0A062V454_9EURY|nr:ATP-binding protein [Candidatus Methanoperedens nitroreducens]KCZ70589.1 putative transcriptional regulator with HTH domain [Candidatus Methanoperedens nitroreducens]MDJ1420443.1 ATP-binding protein [Candidatus Methanoperedens sp.]
MPKNNNGRTVTDQSSMNAYIKSVCDIMRRDRTKGALEYIPELTWMMFLRILDEKEQEEELKCQAVGKSFTPSLKEPYRWRDWGNPHGKKRVELQNGKMGDFLDFVIMFSDRIEISSPGSFIGGVTPHNILTHPPVRRNPLLAEILQYIGAVNRGGLGVDRMYRRLLSYGKLPPEYPELAGAVQVIIRNGAFDEAIAKFVGRKAREGHGWRLEELIVLHHLRRNDKISTSEASEILQRTQRETSELLSSMEGIFIERIGTGRGTYYQLTNEILSSIGEKEKYTRIKGLSEEQKLQLLKNYLENNGKITNEEARNICGVNRNQSLRLIRKLVHKGFLRKIGKGRGAYYEKC